MLLLTIWNVLQKSLAQNGQCSILFHRFVYFLVPYHIFDFAAFCSSSFKLCILSLYFWPEKKKKLYTLLFKRTGNLRHLGRFWRWLTIHTICIEWQFYVQSASLPRLWVQKSHVQNCCQWLSMRQRTGIYTLWTVRNKYQRDDLAELFCFAGLNSYVSPSGFPTSNLM